MIKKITVAIIALLFAGLTGCGGQESQPSLSMAEAKIQVVATIFPLADIARNLGGEKVEVISVIPAGASPHTFEVTPEQVKQFANSQVFIKVGAGLDSFADELVETANPDLVTLTVTEIADLSKALQEYEDPHEEEELHQPEKGHDHHQGGKDPHVWLDPILVKDYIAPQITAVLTQVSPDDAAYFQGNLKSYCAELDRLHKEISDKIASLPHHSFVAFHSAWYYFCDRYGLQDITVEEFPGKEPSAQWIAGVIDTARQQGAQAILVEPQFSPRAAEIIAAEFGAPVVTVDPLGADGVKGYDSYLNMMRSNLKVLEQVLR